MKIDFTKRQIRILLDSLEEANRAYVSKGGSRDFAWEDEQDELENKLNDALVSKKQATPKPKGSIGLNLLMTLIIFFQATFFAYMFLYL